MKKIAIVNVGTKKYVYALSLHKQRLYSNIKNNPNYEYYLISCTDETDFAKNAWEKYFEYFKNFKNVKTKLIQIPVEDDNNKPYKLNAQLLIAQLQSQCFEESRKWEADYCWSLEADVLPQENALRCSLDMLNFDDGYYNVSMCTYPSQGGGGMMGGHGTSKKWIEQNFFLDERNITDEMKKELDEFKSDEKKFFDNKTRPDKEWLERKQKFDKKMEECSPRGNVWTLNGERWRRRGWLEYAYPQIGKGCVVPTDWVGLGCTLLDKKALSVSEFSGYSGHGTQDLYLTWKKWHPKGIKCCVIAHSMCDHVVRHREKNGDQDFTKLTFIHPYHETEGDYIGHMRIDRSVFYTFEGGELTKEEPKEEVITSNTISENKEDTINKKEINVIDI